MSFTSYKRSGLSAITKYDDSLVGNAPTSPYWMNSISSRYLPTGNGMLNPVCPPVVDSSGNIYGIATQDTYGWQNGYYFNRTYIYKYNSSGVLQWETWLDNDSTLPFPYSFALGAYAEPAGIAIDSSANIYVTGVFFANNVAGPYQRGFVAKINSSGVLQWQRSLAESSQNWTHTKGIVADSSGNSYVVGYYDKNDGGTSSFIVKYDTSGTVQWAKLLTDSVSPSSTYGYAIAIDSSANTYVTGYYQTTGGGYGTFVAKYNTSGVLQWQRFLLDSNTGTNQNSEGDAIATDSSGNVYVVGYYTNSSLGYSGYVAKYNTSGTLQWQRSIDEPTVTANSQSFNGYSASVDSSGNLYVTLESGSSSYGAICSGVILKYDTSGVLQWQRLNSKYGYVNVLSSTMYLTGIYSDFEFDSVYSENLPPEYIQRAYNMGNRNYNVFLSGIPTDGSRFKSNKFEFYTFNDFKGIWYATGSLTDSAASLTGSSGTLTDGAAGMAYAVSSLTQTGDSPVTIRIPA